MNEIENKFVIDKEYYFPAYSDGCCSHGGCGASLLVQLDFEEAMIMGRYFRREDPFEMDFDTNFGLKEALDSIMAEEIADSLRREWEIEKEERAQYDDDDDDDDYDDDDDDDDDYDDDEPDFDDQAWDLLSGMYFEWDENLKNDCIEFYKNHLRCPNARNIEYLDY